MKKPLVKKENLDRLLTLLPHLLKAEGNEWFKTEVKKIVRESDGTTEKAQDNLHSYSDMGDSYIISVNPKVLLIDYDNIPDEKVREKLKSDCFEMARHRLGRTNHKPDFEEYCRYAHLQAEELINYYLMKKHSSNLQEIVKFIKAYNPKYDPRSVPTNLAYIDYGFKLFALSKVISFDSPVFYFLKDVRNESSHRSTYSKKSEDTLLDSYNKGVVLTDEQNREVNFIVSKRQGDFEKIYHALTRLKNNLVAKL
jgi:hypothetical protein